MQTLLQSMSQSQLMQLIGGMNDLGGPSGLLAQMGLEHGLGSGSSGSGGESKPSSAVTAPSTGNSTSATTASSKKPEESAPKTTTAPASAASKPSVQLQDLQKILSGMQSSPASSGKNITRLQFFILMMTWWTIDN